MFDKEDYTQDKLYYWIESLIHVRDITNRREYTTIYDLVMNTLETGHDNVSSTLTFDGVEYTFNMTLKKEDTHKCTCNCEHDTKRILHKALDSLNDLDCD